MYIEILVLEISFLRYFLCPANNIPHLLPFGLHHISRHAANLRHSSLWSANNHLDRTSPCHAQEIVISLSIITHSPYQNAHRISILVLSSCRSMR